MPLVLDTGIQISEGDFDVLAVDCSQYLDSGETVASGTITEKGTSDLTLGAVTPNVAALVFEHKSVAIGNAITATVSGQKVKGSPYYVAIVITTSAGRKKAFQCKFEVD